MINIYLIILCGLFIVLSLYLYNYYNIRYKNKNNKNDKNNKKKLLKINNKKGGSYFLLNDI
jgi:preprotein translocase subunit SecG